MKAAISDGKGKIWIEDIPCPQPNDYQALCKIEACATCTGTDKTLVRGLMPWAKEYPAILGHESFGTVVECGKKVRNIQKGDRFLRPCASYWGSLYHGFASWMGGYAEYGLVTDTAALLADSPDAPLSSYMQYQQKLPADVEITPEDATMLITLKEVSSFIRDLGIRPASKVVVLGAGAVALAMCFFAKLAGAQCVVAVARRAEELARCAGVGADATVNTQDGALGAQLQTATHGGADFVLDGSGNAALLTEAARGLAEGGALCPYAVCLDPQPRLSEFAAPPHWKYLSCPPDEVSAHPYLMSLIRMKAIPFQRFYSHTMPLAEIAKGFQMLFAKTAAKIVFTM